MVLHGSSDSPSLDDMKEKLKKKEEEAQKEMFKNVIIGCLGFFIVLPIATVLGCVVDVFLFRQLVEWFVLPLDEAIGTYLLNIHWATLLGLLLLKSFIIRQPLKHHKQKDNSPDTSMNKAFNTMLGGFFYEIILRPLVYLVLGYIFTLFM